MATITIMLKNGKEFDFDTSLFKVNGASKAQGVKKITSLEWNMKDKGRSLVFVDTDEIAAIVRDTRTSDDFES